MQPQPTPDSPADPNASTLKNEPLASGAAGPGVVASTENSREIRGNSAMAAVALLTLAALVLRTYASLGDLWLDEVWSLKLATHITSWTQVFTKINVENNHHLNTLWLYLLGDGLPFVFYRLHSIVAGGATVLFMAIIARRWGTAASVFAAVLGATSYLLVHYSSEARGYSVMLLAVVASVWLSLRYVKKPSLALATAIGLVLSVGLLSQLVIALFAAVLGAWMVVVFWCGISDGNDSLVFTSEGQWYLRLPNFPSSIQKSGGVVVLRRSATLSLGWSAVCFVLPLVTFVLLWVVNLSKIPPGGANPTDGLAVMFSGLSLMLGGPHDGVIAALLFKAAIAIPIARVLMPNRRIDPLAWLALAIVVMSMLLPVLGALRHTPMAVRYLLPLLPLVLLILAWFLNELWMSRKIVDRAIAAGLIAIFVAAQVNHLIPLLRDGHGMYLSAMQYMAANDTTDAIQISSDHDFRQLTLLDYYLYSLPPGKTIEYRNRNDLPAGGTTWLIMHAIEPAASPTPPQLLQAHNGEFKLVATFPSAPLSGWTWHIYRNVRK